MTERLKKALLPLLLAALCNVAPAQTVIETQRDTKPTQEIQKPTPQATGIEHGRPVSVKLGRGGSVAVDNRTTGPIVVTGWDKDYVEARATSERGAEAVRYTVVGDGPEQKVWLKGDYAIREESASVPPQPKPEPEGPKPEPESDGAKPVPTPTPTPVIEPKEIRMPGGKQVSNEVGDPPSRDGQLIEVKLEVRVPRYAEIEAIRVIKSPVQVTGVDAPVTVIGSRSEVVLRDVGAAEVRTRDGKVDVENARGLVDVVTTTGPIRVRRSAGDVRVLSISGEVDVACVRGRVNVDTTSGPVRLSEISGDVDATASNSNVSFSGEVREDGRYRLKSMSGAVEMALRDKAYGFTAELSSYRGTIENEFKLKIKPASQQEGEVNRRLIGSYGAGRAQVSLDTFDGKVRLTRGASASAECK